LQAIWVSSEKEADMKFAPLSLCLAAQLYT
jgi:hypothetical protein